MAEKKKQLKVALVSMDIVGTTMAGPGIRYFELAKALARQCQVVLLVPDKSDLQVENLTIKTYNSKRVSSSLAEVIDKSYDFLIAQNLRPPFLRHLQKNHVKYITDLYDPLTIEVLEYAKYDKLSQQSNLFDFNYYSLLLQIHSASHLLCASDRQRDFYTGILSDQRLLTPAAYATSPNLDHRFSVIPFGLSQSNPLPKDQTAIERKFPGIRKSDKIVYWGGGVWNWFDPMTVIKAIEKISQQRDDIKLVFLGVKHPNPKIKQMEMAAKALSYCREKNLLDRFVFFNFDWTPYADRVDYLLRASVGVSTHFDNLETRFSFRTRVLDYLWAELPMILTEGDSMADLCRQRQLGRVVPFSDVNSVVEAILQLIDNSQLRHEIKQSIQTAKTAYYWETIAENLFAVMKSGRILQPDHRVLRFIKLSAAFYFAGLKKKVLK